MVEKTAAEEEPKEGGGQQFESQTLTDHLSELRSCLIKSFLTIIVGFALSYSFIKPIGTWFFKPLIDVLPEGSSLIFTSYQEGFFLSKARPCLRSPLCHSSYFLSDLALHSPRSL